MLRAVDISNAHNLNVPAKAVASGHYGIRVTLPAGEPFANLLDEGWSAEHWFTEESDRDAALQDMAREHEFSRAGDRPTLIFTAIIRETD